MPNLISLFIAALFYLIVGQMPVETVQTPVSQSDAGVVEPFLAPGLEEIKKAIALREDFMKKGFDFNKAEHVPELEQQLPILTAYYQKAVENSPKTKKRLDKILKEMRSAFDKKRMSMAAWTGFHGQLNRLFSETNFDLSPAKGTVLRWFIYEREGILGLQALNLSFVSDIEAIPAATAETVRADGVDFDPVALAYHDANHFDFFKFSPYGFKRFSNALKAVYSRIEAQQDHIERARDHLVLFMFIHESLANPYYYHETLADAFRDSYNSMTKILRSRFGRGKDGIKSAIFRELVRNVLHENMSIQRIAPKTYEIKGRLIDTERPVVYQATVVEENNRLMIRITQDGTEKRVIDTSAIRFSDFDLILKALCTKGTYSDLTIAPAMDEFARSFLRKYTENNNA